ncbi:MAG: type II secretion system protein M [Betaproteobacteria bacterium]|nr:type II secretion system protein M [Betaproteobacteria bacterium]
MASIARLRKSTRLQTLIAVTRTRWHALAARERVLVSIALALLVVAGIWLLLLRPALRTRAEAPPRIEQLRTTLTRVQAQADELGRLAALPANHAQVSDVGEAARLWLREHGAQAQIAALPGDINIQVQHLPSWALAVLARTARTQWAARVVSAKLKADSGGTLSGSIGLQPATPDNAGGADSASQGEQRGAR